MTNIMIQGRKEDDLIKFFDDKQKYVGYIDENEHVYYIGKGGYAVKIGEAETPRHAVEMLKVRHAQKSATMPTAEQHLIGTLTAKLACYEPNSDIVKKAMKFLEGLE